jgi:type II secretory pathway pseudopilin PulG
MKLKGFTTIDLVVSIGIIALLVGFALFNVQSARKTSELDSAFSQVQSALSTVRTLSLGGKVIDRPDEVPGFGVRFSLSDPSRLISFYSYEPTGEYAVGNELSYSPNVFKDIELTSLCYAVTETVATEPCGAGWQTIDSFVDLTFVSSGDVLLNTESAVESANFVGGAFTHQKTGRSFYFYVSLRGGLIVSQKL